MSELLVVSNRTISSLTSCTSDVEKPEAESMNTASRTSPGGVGVTGVGVTGVLASDPEPPHAADAAIRTKSTANDDFMVPPLFKLSLFDVHPLDL
jgi:hypothetical protein